MDVGICLPYNEHGYARDSTLDWCRSVDAGPFSSLSCGERIASHSQHMATLMSAACALTERVRIMPSLYVLPLHPTAFAAKELATMDVLSGGRVTAVVGVGGREQDYRAVGVPFSHRHQRLDDQIEEMRRIWAQEPPAEGVDPIGPVPVQAGGPPLLAGSMGARAIARAAKWADGVYGFTLNGNPDPARQGFALAETAWAEAGRDSRPRRMTGFWYTLSPDDAEHKLREYVYDYMKVNDPKVARAVANTMQTFTPDAVRRALDDLEQVGCEECVLVPATLEIAEVERAAEVIARR